MARNDFDHEEDRGHYGDWRDDEGYRHRSVGRGREPSDPREQHFGRFDEGYSGARERGPAYREHERLDPGSGSSSWHRDDREPMGGSYSRGSHSGSEGDRGRRMAEPGDRRRGSDWDAEYGHAVDWNRHQDRDTWSSHDPRGRQYWDRGHTERGFSRFGQPDRWSSDGPFVGRGPRGYRRSDERIKEDVCEALTRHGRIDATDLEVTVEEGVVTLRGAVDGRHTKRLVEDVVDDVPGVRDVHNNLGIHHPDTGMNAHGYTTAGPSHQPLDDEGSHYAPDQNRERQPFSSPAGEDASSASEGRFLSSAGSEHRERMREGMEVVGSDGNNVGDVKEISNNSFLVDRSMKRDLYIPFAAIRSMSGNRITLSLRADEVDDQGWATPDLMGTSKGDTSH